MRLFLLLTLLLPISAHAASERFYSTAREAEAGQVSEFLSATNYWSVRSTVYISPSTVENHTCYLWRNYFSSGGGFPTVLYTYHYFCADGYMGFDGARVPEYWFFIGLTALFGLCIWLIFRVRRR